jgi:CRP-like cAMP-binding protein
MNLTELFGKETDLVTVPAGEALFRAGDPPGGVMYVLMHGSVDILIGDTIVETAGPGALLGEMGLIDPAKRSATAMVRSECRFVRIDMKRFHLLIQQTPEFATHVMKVIVKRLRSMDAKLLEMQAAMKTR